MTDTNANDDEQTATARTEEQFNALFSAFKREVGEAAEHSEFGACQNVRRADAEEFREFCRVYDVRRVGDDEPNHGELFALEAEDGEIEPILYGIDLDDPDDALGWHFKLREVVDEHFGGYEVIR